MKKDRFHNFDDEVRDLVLDFENTVLKGRTQFFDVDEMEIIIDYYFEVNDLKPLERAVEYAEELYPNSTTIRLRRAHLMMSHEQYWMALKVLNQMRQAEPDNTDVAYSLGVANGAVGESEKAIAYFKEAARDGWMLGRVYANMAEEYYKLKDYDSALNFYRKAMESDSCDDITIYNYYDVSYVSGRIEQAEDYLDNYVKKNPYSKEAWYCLGCAYRDLTLYEKAVDAFEFAIAIDKCYVDAYVALSQTQDFMGCTSEAVTTMIRVLDYCDDRAKVYRTIGNLYAREANYDTAMAYFKKAIDDNPNDAEAYAAIALCYMETGDNAMALSSVKRAVLLDDTYPMPDSPEGDPEVLCAAAMVYDATGDFNKASGFFERLITSNLYTEPQCQIYTQFLYKHKVYDILIFFAEESLEAYPHDTFYSTYLAACYFYTNRYNRARKMLPDVSPAMLAEICPEIMVHPLLGPLVPADPYANSPENNKHHDE
ncbi:MAG: tetratricopeptide repeat protein [Bacteroidales bacterium]|nr:tetratricopeptide repeat protein [Bacteroidales bacterium]